MKKCKKKGGKEGSVYTFGFVFVENNSILHHMGLFSDYIIYCT